MSVLNAMFADIITKQSGPKSIFTYKIPNDLRDDVHAGSVVFVPLKNRREVGVVQEVHNKKMSFAVKELIKIIHPDLNISLPQLEIAKWMRDQFMAHFSDCVFSFLPITTKPPKGLNTEYGILNNGEGRKSVGEFRMTADQQEAYRVIAESDSPVLLYGVTGSGKTEVYLQYAEEILKDGGSVLILVPEISLTPQTTKRFIERFGDTVTVWNSELLASERRLTYWQVKYGKKRLVVGSRSAIFLPFQNLKLIVIDEEHEKSYYQESSPRYNTTLLAEKISSDSEAKLILGSATPSIESVWKVSQKQYKIAKLDTRIGNAPMPKTVIVDMKHEKLGSNRMISNILGQHLLDNVKKHRQSVLLLNRRGHSTTASCTDCGYVKFCQNCNVPLTAHYQNSNVPRLICHHCGSVEAIMSICPICKSANIKLKGAGTERVEDEIKQLISGVRILRMDRDTTATRLAIDKMYYDFANHHYDVLLGTQMIAKGWDIPTVDLVGVLLAEGGMMLPDYHAMMNAFDLLVQVSGRSGRAGNPGLTVIQTYQPDHPMIRAAAKHDFGGYVKTELKNRQQFQYPPFINLIRLVFQHQKEVVCAENSAKLKFQIDNSFSNGFEILGPAPCYFERLHGKYRYQIIIKVIDSEKLASIKDFCRNLEKPWIAELNPPQVL